MTESDWKVLETYVAETARTMGLGRWRITLDREPASEENDAQVYCTTGQASARIRIAEDFSTLTAQRQRYCIVHELTHAFFANVTDIVDEDLCKSRLLSAPMYDLFKLSFNRQMEYGIDAAADAIAQFIPLIPWETGRNDVKALADEYDKLREKDTAYTDPETLKRMTEISAEFAAMFPAPEVV